MCQIFFFSQETNPNISGKDSTSSQTSTCSSESESESSDVDGTSVSDTSEDSISMIKSKVTLFEKWQWIYLRVK